MSNYFQVSISVAYLIVIHNNSKGVIYVRGAPTEEFDPKFLEEVRRAIQFEEIDLPEIEGDISQASIKNKYVVMRAGKLTTTILVISQKPNRFTREALHSFSIRMESRWGRELRKLYNELEGDINVFHKNTDTRENLNRLVDEVFHLDFTLPHKLGLPPNDMKRNTKRVWGVAEDLARGKGYILLGELLTEGKDRLNRSKGVIADIIFDFVSRGAMTPIPLDEFLDKYSNP